MNGTNDMTELQVFWSGLPDWGRVALVALVVFQLAIEIYALVRLVRTPDERLVFGKKWPWVLIIVFVNIVGAVIFLAVGRTSAPAADPLAGQGSGDGRGQTADRAARAADVLYGPSDGDAS